MSDLQDRVRRDQRLVGTGAKRAARLRRRLRHQTALNARRRARLKIEREKLAKSNHGVSGALRWALDLASRGVSEQPPFSNRGPHITAWQQNSGYPNAGVPWCQCFVNAFMVMAGLPQLKTGYTVAVVQMAINRQNGLRLIGRGPGAMYAAKPGDLIYYKWPGVSRDSCDHVGVLVDADHDLEGNTSPGASGSQNNGGGLYLRALDGSRRPFVAFVVRPSYNA